MDLAFAVRIAMRTNGKSTRGVSAAESLRWAGSHINAVKQIVEEYGWQERTS